MSALARPSAADLPAQDAVMSQAGAENFTVASAILGRQAVRHLMAIYGFARLVDDVGDESTGDRGALLEIVALELDRVYEDGPPEHPLMVELARTVRECSLPRGPFERLIEANRMDQVVTRYETFEQLLEYCQLSAAPVGELVLGVFGAATPDRIARSDRVCAGLQVVEHLQDIAEDHARGRVYMPREDLVRFGCDDGDLTGQPTGAVRELIAFESVRARRLLASGGPLARSLPPRQRLAVAGFVAGGRSALAALDAAPLTAPSHKAGRLARRGFAKQLLRAVAGR